MLYKAAVIGDSQTVMGFKAVGLTTASANDGEEAASRLFAFLRFADRQNGYNGICMSPIPETGLGLAINDRIRRAAYKE